MHLRALIALSAMLITLTASGAPGPTLAQAVADSGRSATFVARDTARHPLEELTFFDVKADMTVVEFWPGGGYWTEILGPFLKQKGRYVVAFAPTTDEPEVDDAWHKRVHAQANRLGAIQEVLAGPGHYDFAPAGSVDRVLTFRNLHNWMDGGYAGEMLSAAFRALKPGGILGVEAHRGRSDRPQDPKAADGYVREDFAITLAEKAGFKLIGKSEINANPRDTKDWVDGVWTLPPTLSQKDKDRERYIAVGEADNFVLKFEKPRR
jgi:SAM-dependent methyltransferase